MTRTTPSGGSRPIIAIVAVVQVACYGSWALGPGSQADHDAWTTEPSSDGALAEADGSPEDAEADPVEWAVIFGEPGLHEFAVPDGVRSIRVALFGAGGGGMSALDLVGGSGGDGGYLHATIDVLPGDRYQVHVGGGGHGASCGEWTSGGGGGGLSALLDGAGAALLSAGGGGGGLVGLDACHGGGSCPWPGFGVAAAGWGGGGQAGGGDATDGRSGYGYEDGYAGGWAGHAGCGGLTGHGGPGGGGGGGGTGDAFGGGGGGGGYPGGCGGTRGYPGGGGSNFAVYGALVLEDSSSGAAGGAPGEDGSAGAVWIGY